MDFSDKMKKTADLWFPDEQQINTDKGRAFEKYVAELFTRNEKYFSIFKWARPDQIKRYNDFSKEKDVPVFIVIGLSGEPNNPERMFCIPLTDAKYSEIFLSVLEKYERDPQKTFFWKDGTLS